MNEEASQQDIISKAFDEWLNADPRVYVLEDGSVDPVQRLREAFTAGWHGAADAAWDHLGRLIDDSRKSWQGEGAAIERERIISLISMGGKAHET